MNSADSPSDGIGSVQVLGHTLLATGAFDEANDETFCSALRVLARDGARFTVDLTGVTYFDDRAMDAVWLTTSLKSTVLLASGSMLERSCRSVGLHLVTQVCSVRSSTASGSAA